MIKDKNISPDAAIDPGKIAGADFGKRIYVAPAGGTNQSDWSAKAPQGQYWATIAGGITAARSGYMDKVILAPESHSQAAALTLSKNMVSIIGAYPASLMNQRSRIGHSANIDALLTVSGYGNLLENIYFMHGRGSNTNVHCLEVTGARNTFRRVHFGGPMHATEAALATYSVVELTGAQECLFEDCVLGIETTARSAANSILRIGSDGTTRNIFRNCIFLSMCSATTPYFIEVAAAVTYGWHLFQNCSFINFASSWTTALALGINFACDVIDHRIIMENCTFYGVTDVAAAAKEGGVLFNTIPAVNTSVTGATGIGLPLQHDHTA